MELVDMRDLKSRPLLGPGSSPGAGNLPITAYFKLRINEIKFF